MDGHLFFYIFQFGSMHSPESEAKSGLFVIHDRSSNIRIIEDELLDAKKKLTNCFVELQL